MDSIRHFNEIAGYYEDLRPVYIPLMDKLATVLEIKDSDVVVDYGCGPGHDLKYLTERYKIKPIGIDKSAEMCRLASTKIGLKNIINGDDQYSVLNLNFDKIYFKFVMHHIKHPLQFIDDIIDHLKIGNSFAFVTMLPKNVDSYVILKYFPSLLPVLKRESEKQLEIIEHIEQNALITFNRLECDVSEEVFDESLIYKLQKNYSSFFSILSEAEKNQGIEKIKEELKKNYNNKHVTKGIIGYGRKE